MEAEGWAVREKEGRRTALWLLTIELGDLRIRTSRISDSEEGVEVIERGSRSVRGHEKAVDWTMIDKGQMISYKVGRWTVESGRSSGGALPRRPSWKAGKSPVNVGRGEKL